MKKQPGRMPTVSSRPPIGQRKFICNSVETTIARVKKDIKDPETALLFENCYPNTLDTTVEFAKSGRAPDTFIITGDIDALWLRDSTAQVWPYMNLISHDEKLRTLVLGLINRQIRCVLLDPYANSFEQDPAKSGWESDIPKNKPGIHERKWELDSLCYVIRLVYEYYRVTGDQCVFTKKWDTAFRLIVSTMKTEQRKNGVSPYSFIRKTIHMIDAPPFFGKGQPLRPVGLIASMFRPSDDSTLFPFLIPSNLFAINELRHLADLYSTVIKDAAFSLECKNLADEVETAVKEFGVVKHKEFGLIYAYEVDGYGNYVCMDDANVPSLMSLPYLGVCGRNDPMYKRTRQFLLSDHNPYFLTGKAAQGQASPHTGRNNIWPMGIILRALTSDNKDEIRSCLSMLKKTHAGTGFMHESFNKDNASDFTRSWFAWANTLFGELILKIHKEYPDLLA